MKFPRGVSETDRSSTKRYGPVALLAVSVTLVATLVGTTRRCIERIHIFVIDRLNTCIKVRVGAASSGQHQRRISMGSAPSDIGAQFGLI